MKYAQSNEKSYNNPPQRNGNGYLKTKDGTKQIQTSKNQNTHLHNPLKTRKKLS